MFQGSATVGGPQRPSVPTISEGGGGSCHSGLGVKGSRSVSDLQRYLAQFVDPHKFI